MLFYYHGPVVAGQMGMTLIASNALLAVCMTWMNTKSPEFGKLIALRNWKSLDQLFFLTMKQSIVIALLGSLAGFFIILFLQSNLLIGQRFIPATQVAFLLGAVCIQTINSAFAIYLRAHKKEPFMWLSIIVGIIQGLTTWFMGMRYGSFGVTVGFFMVVCFITFPAAWFIWKKCRHNWHHVGMDQLPVHIEK